MFRVFCGVGKVERSQCSLQADVYCYVVATDEQVGIRPDESWWIVNQTGLSLVLFYFFCSFVSI